MQRGVLEEDVLDQRRRHLGVEGDAAFGDQPQVALLTDDDECPGLRLGHLAAGRDDRHDVGLHRVVTRREDAGDEVEVLLAHPDHLQEPPQFGLEYDDQRNGPDRDQLSEYRRQQFHVERPHHHPQQVDGDDPREDIGRVGAFGHAVDPVHDHGDQDDVYEIDECERNETHCLCVAVSFPANV